MRSMGGGVDKLNQELALGTSPKKKLERCPGWPVILLVVFLAALGLRLWGIGFGRDLPPEVPLTFSYHQDEPKTLTRALKIAETGDLNPRWFHYPSLGLYLQAATLFFGSVLGDWDPYLVGRATTALIGALTCLVVFFAARRIGGVGGGLAGATFVALSFLHARSSHFVTTDVPMVFWIILSIFFCLAFFEELGDGRGRSRFLWLSFVCVGFAAGTKYNGAGALALPVLAALLRNDRWIVRIRGAVVGGVLFVGAFVATTPYILSDPETFRIWFEYLRDYQNRGQFGFERSGFFENLAYLGERLTSQGLGLVGTLLALFGTVIGWVDPRLRRQVMLLLGYSFVYLVWLSTYKTSFTRNLIPIVPALAVLGGLGYAIAFRHLAQISGGRTARAVVFVALSGACWVFPIRDLIVYDSAIADSTRTRSLHWIAETIPAGSRLATEVYGPPIRQVHPGRYQMLEVWSFGEDIPSVESFRRGKIDFILTNAGASEMAFSNPGRYPAAEAVYSDIYSNYRLIKVFEGERVDPLYSSICPTIKVYDCRDAREEESNE